MAHALRDVRDGTVAVEQRPARAIPSGGIRAYGATRRTHGSRRRATRRDPNTNLGHNSIIFMIECQTGYIMDCLRQMDVRGLRSIDVRPETLEAYNAHVQRALAGTAWAATGKS
jgi:hypothetical protein